MPNHKPQVTSEPLFTVGPVSVYRAHANSDVSRPLAFRYCTDLSGDNWFDVRTLGLHLRRLEDCLTPELHEEVIREAIQRGLLRG